MRPTKTRSGFTALAKRTSHWTGRPSAFYVAAGIVLVWLATGPLFDFSNTWQLVINTSTTVITFLMVFLIQSTQNRDSEAMQVKLDELLRVTRGAHNVLLDLEELEDRELDAIKDTYCEIAESAREQLRQGGVDTDVPQIDHPGPR